MKAVILAAGKGTRLLPYSNILPKALMPVALNKDNSFMSVIEKLIHQINNADINEIFIVINYKGDLIKEFLGDGSNYNCKIKYVVQDVLDGNGGAFYRCQSFLNNEDVFVTDCDNYISDDSFIQNMRLIHESKKSDCTVAVSKVNDITKFAIIKTDEKNLPIDIFEKPTDVKVWGNLAKSGLMMFSNKLAMMDKSISQTNAKEQYTTTQIIKHCITHKNELKIQLFSIQSGFHDIGTWNEYLPILKNNLNLN